MMGWVLRVYRSKRGVDIVVTSQLLGWLFIGHTKGRMIRLPCSCLLLCFDNASYDCFNKAVQSYEKSWDSWNNWFGFKLVGPLDVLQRLKSSSEIFQGLDVDGEFRWQSVEWSDNRLLQFTPCWAHYIRCNTVDSASDRMNRDTKQVETCTIASTFVRVREFLAVVYYAYVIAVVMNQCAKEISDAEDGWYVTPASDLAVFELLRQLA